MKKILAFILTLTTALTLIFSLTACTNSSEEEDEWDETYLKRFDFELAEDEKALPKSPVWDECMERLKK